MDFLDISLIISITLCSLVSGFIFTYAIVVMPGLSKLSDKEFIRAFQVTDSVIQNNQPLLMFVWIGSIVSLLSALLISVVSFGLSESCPLVLISAVYLLGVQGITTAIHIPLNKRIHQIGLEGLSDEAVTRERSNFESKWNHGNNIRTSVSIVTSLLLLILLSLR